MSMNLRHYTNENKNNSVDSNVDLHIVHTHTYALIILYELYVPTPTFSEISEKKFREIFPHPTSHLNLYVYVIRDIPEDVRTGGRKNPLKITIGRALCLYAS